MAILSILEQRWFSLMRFLLHSFLILFRYSFLTLFFRLCFLLMSASNIPTYLLVSFYQSILLLSWFGCFIPSVICRFPLFIVSMAHFSRPNSIPISWLYILTVCIRVSNCLSFFISSTYIWWLIFFLRLMKFVCASAFPKYVIQWSHRYYKY